MEDDKIGEAQATLWSKATPSIWNRNPAAVGSRPAWCADKQPWTAPELPAATERRRENNDDPGFAVRALRNWHDFIAARSTNDR